MDRRRSWPKSAWGLFLSWQRFIRLPAFGFSALVPLLGAASARPDLPAPQVWGLLGVALAYHQFGYVLNDVVDLEVDRGHPSRAGYPLVRGMVRPSRALAFALAQIPLALALTAWLNGGPPAYAALAVAFAAGAIYDVWGKRTAFPPLTDAAQGLGWAAFALYGAAIAQAPPTRLTWALAAYLVVYIVLVNGVHGAMRDLASDSAAGVRTTALLLGARPAPGGWSVSRRLIGYAAALQCLLAAMLLWALLANDFGYPPATWATVLAATVAIQCACAAATALMLRPARRLAIAAPVMSYIILSLIGLIVLFGPYLGPAARLAVLAAYFGPLLIHDTLYKMLGRLWRGRVAAGSQ